MAPYASLDAFKAQAMVTLLIMHAMEEVTHSCVAECNWTSAVFYLEYMSGSWFMLHGLGSTLSVCQQLSGGHAWKRVLGRAALRAAVLIVVGVVAQAAAALFRVWLHPQDDGFSVNLSDSIGTTVLEAVLRAICEPRALMFHGVCGLLTNTALVACLELLPAHRWSLASPLLLLMASTVLLAHPPLRRAVDRSTCCAKVLCNDTEAAAPGHGPPFRVPTRCTIVVGNGSLLAGSAFDPCDFDAAGGGLYMRPCIQRMSMRQPPNDTAGGGGVACATSVATDVSSNGFREDTPHGERPSLSPNPKPAGNASPHPQPTLTLIRNLTSWVSL